MHMPHMKPIIPNFVASPQPQKTPAKTAETFLVGLVGDGLDKDRRPGKFFRNEADDDSPASGAPAAPRSARDTDVEAAAPASSMDSFLARQTAHALSASPDPAAREGGASRGAPANDAMQEPSLELLLRRLA